MAEAEKGKRSLQDQVVYDAGFLDAVMAAVASEGYTATDLDITDRVLEIEAAAALYLRPLAERTELEKRYDIGDLYKKEALQSLGRIAGLKQVTAGWGEGGPES
jgi:hypothetical protein